MLRLIHSVCMPSPLPRQARWNRFAHYCSIVFGLPQITVGSAPAFTVSRPAQRSLTLQPTDSPSRLMRPSPPEAPAALLPPPPLRLLPGGAIQFPGGFISRCGPAPFTAHCKRLVKTRLAVVPAITRRCDQYWTDGCLALVLLCLFLEKSGLCVARV